MATKYSYMDTPESARHDETGTEGWSRLDRIDDWLRARLRRWGVPLLRISLGLVFVLFGLKKVFGVSPIAELVEQTLPLFDPAWLLPALGWFEIVVGVALLVGRWLRATLVLTAGELLGTFLVLVVQPAAAFQPDHPIALSTEGEFVVKNLVLLSACFVVAGALPARRRTRDGG
ncbi:MAG: DoxX family protein [Egibacteraceae bacterium]